MDFLNRNYRYFLTIAEQGSMVSASQTLRVGQPALSLAMSQLEKEIGTKLFSKEGRRLILSVQGQKFAEALRKGDRYLLGETAKALGDLSSNPIRVGIVSHVAIKSIIPALPRIERQFGSLQTHMGYSKKIFDLVRTGDLDFGIISWTSREPRWPNVKLLKDDPEAIVGERKKFAHLKDIRSMKDLRDEKWIWHSMPQKTLVDYLKPAEHGVVVDNYSILKELLFSGYGISAVQLDTFSESEKKKLVIAPIKPRSPKELSKIYLVYNDGLEQRQLELMKLFENLIKS